MIPLTTTNNTTIWLNRRDIHHIIEHPLGTMIVVWNQPIYRVKESRDVIRQRITSTQKAVVS